jgi:acyl-CoA thioester hydrolase
MESTRGPTVTEMASGSVPLRLHETRVRPEWVDYNGHMSEAFYVLIFGYATDALLDLIGMDHAYRTKTGNSLYTLEAHVTYLREVIEGEPVGVTTQLLELDHKRLRVFHAMHHAERDHLIATEELLLCNVDAATSRSAPIQEEIAARLRSMLDTHRGLPVPEQAGRSIALRHAPLP